MYAFLRNFYGYFRRNLRVPSGYHVAVPVGDSNRPNIFWTAQIYSPSLSSPHHSLVSFSFFKIRTVQNMFRRFKSLDGVPGVWYPTGTQKLVVFETSEFINLSYIFFKRPTSNTACLARYALLIYCLIKKKYQIFGYLRIMIFPLYHFCFIRQHIVFVEINIPVLSN